MPRWPSKGNKGKKWSPEHRAKYMATIQAKAAKAAAPRSATATLTELPAILDAEIERLQKVRDLLR